MKTMDIVRDACRRHPQRIAIVAINSGIAAAICAVVLAITGCFATAPSVAQTEAAIEAADSCVQSEWGQPIGVIAATCFNASAEAAEDAIADIEAIVEGNDPALSILDAGTSAMTRTFPYETSSMRAKIEARKAVRFSKK